ncbi:anthranilate synthase component II [Fusibacter sp. JL216-2]|uniref:anthranilate synthase component II n=1 Tax=Fusibacter sp. JL216-2 TaxID=3071453 RepID=UPI003D352AED
MILMIDNYDSFTYNLVQYLKTLNETVEVYRNDSISIEEIRKMKPEMIVISPGPSTPNEAGISLEIVEKLSGQIPILGICLGHQTIGQVYGGKIVKASEPVHGKVFPICHDDKGVFKALNQPLNVTRYHSLVIEKETLPDCLEVTAQTEDGQIMGIRHKDFLLEGVQFHPEAVLTEQGHELLANFLEKAKAFVKGGGGVSCL